MNELYRPAPVRLGEEPSSPETKLALPALTELCNSPDHHLDSFDVAALNLACTAGLPGTETLEVDKLFDWLDEAARTVDFETRRHWYRFLASPQIYLNSPGYFCCYFLLQVLQEEFGVKYNPVRAADSKFQDPNCLDPDFRDSRDLFIHGIVDGPGGTCASLPVLYVAVGRRLGYPLRLVESRAHLFFRWDDPLGKRLGLAERVNIEGAGSGISSYPDDFYRTWPEPWTAADEACGMYLRSLAPGEELAAFLSTRGECLHDNGRIDEAVQAYRWACELAHDDPRYRWRLEQILWRSQRNLLDINEIIAIGRSAALGSQPFVRAFEGDIASRRVPLHGGDCRCRDCQRAKTTERETSLPKHSPSCECYHCRARRLTLAESAEQSPYSSLTEQRILSSAARPGGRALSSWAFTSV